MPCVFMFFARDAVLLESSWAILRVLLDTIPCPHAAKYVDWTQRDMGDKGACCVDADLA